MTLSFKVLGFELARIDLELPPAAVRELTPLDRGIKGMSNFWVRRMNR